MKFPGNEQSRSKVRLEDYTDEPFYKQLLRLPKPVAERCLEIIERDDLDDDEATRLIFEKITQRKEVMTQTQFSDPEFEAFAREYPGDLLEYIEGDLFNDTSKQVGHGTTAKVHELDTDDRLGKVAVKYLVTPEAGTVSSEKEHNIVREVERISSLEKIIENSSSGSTIRVPHPYFSHQTERVQCYGMKLINGTNLKKAIQGRVSPELLTGLQESNFGDRDIAELEAEIDQFFEAVHSYCLHGSVKADNLMIDANGQFYLVDFGNSTLNTELKSGDEAWAEARKEDEVTAAKTVIRKFLNVFRQLTSESQMAA